MIPFFDLLKILNFIYVVFKCLFIFYLNVFYSVLASNGTENGGDTNSIILILIVLFLLSKAQNDMNLSLLISKRKSKAIKTPKQSV